MGNPLRYAFVLLAVVAFVRYGSSEEQSSPGESTANSTTAVPLTSTPVTTVTSTTSNANNSVTNSTTTTTSPVTVTTPTPNNVTEKLVDIKVYYEALCIDSVNFFKDQLKPTYDDYNKYINVSFIPFAQGTITRNSTDPNDKNTTLSCKRNATECDADKVHACAINKINEEDKLVKFVTCALVEGIKNNTVPIEKCCNDSSINNNMTLSIIECSKGFESYPWLELYMNESKKANVSTAPTIVINQNVFEEKKDLSLMNDVKEIVCSTLPNDASCESHNNSTSSVVIGVLVVIVVILMIVCMFFVIRTIKSD